MDGENNGKPYEQMDDLGVPFFVEMAISWFLKEEFCSPKTMDGWTSSVVVPTGWMDAPAP